MSTVSCCKGLHHVFGTLDYPEHLVTLDVTNPEEDLGDGVSIQKLDLGAGAVHGGNLLAAKLQDGEAHLRRGQRHQDKIRQNL